MAAPPAAHLATVAQLPCGVDEIRLAGGMMGEAVNVAKRKTVDLLDPADAGIIIEGEIHPGKTVPTSKASADLMDNSQVVTPSPQQSLGAISC